MFFCKNWDLLLEKEVYMYSDNLFYLTGTNVSKDNVLINLENLKVTINILFFIY